MCIRDSYTILGPWDVDSERGFISYLSPLGKALIGHNSGDEVAFEVPSGTIECKILEVTDGLAAAEEATAEA